MKRVAITVLFAFLACSKDVPAPPPPEFFPIFLTGTMFPGFEDNSDPNQAQQTKFIQRLKTMLDGKKWDGVAGYNFFDLGHDTTCDYLKSSTSSTISGRTYTNGFAWPPIVCNYGFWGETAVAKSAWDEWRKTSATTDFPLAKRAIAVNDRDARQIKQFAIPMSTVQSGGDIAFIARPIFDVIGKVGNAGAADADFRLVNTTNNIFATMADAGWVPQRVALAVDLLDPIRAATAPTGPSSPGRPFPSGATGLSNSCDTSGGATFATSCYRTYVKQEIRTVATAKDPEWLFIGMSLERYAIASPQDFTNLASLYREVYMDLKDAGIRAKIGPAFDWDRLQAQALAGGTAQDGGADAGGATGISIETYWATVVAPFLNLPVVDGGATTYTGALTADTIGIASYLDSANFGGGADNVPLTYYSKIFDLSVKTKP